MALFRFHKGALKESLETTIIVKNINQLMDEIRNYYGTVIPTLSEFGIITNTYVDKDHHFDKRTGWYTQIVTADIYKRGDFVVVGFLSEPLDQ